MTNTNYSKAIDRLMEQNSQAKKVQAAYMRELYTTEKPNDLYTSLRAFPYRLEALIRV
jgi:hypothetical protein